MSRRRMTAACMASARWLARISGKAETAASRFRTFSLPTHTPMLTVTHLRKSFGELTAVDDVSFTIRAGEVVGLLGPNGAGKTTTVSMISALIRPDAGSVMIDGTVIEGDTNPAKRRIEIGRASCRERV